MRAHRGTIGLLGPLSAALLAAACAGGKRAQRGAPATAHPVVDTGLDTCAGWHAQATPEIAAQWSGSRHGIDLVGCIVCHGSTGPDFRAHPEPVGCAGCHSAEVASVTRDGATRSCFGCHPPHALHADASTSPHGAATQGARP